MTPWWRTAPGGRGRPWQAGRVRTDFDPRSDDTNTYALLSSLVVPRPIAWVASRSADGVGNLAPHSFFTVVCADPPVVAFASIGDKDTLRNVVATGEFTVSVATLPLMDQVNDSSARFAPDQDEAAELGVEMRPSTVVGPPAVAASPASIECRLHSTVDLGSSTLVLGEVVWISVEDDVVVDGLPSYDRMQPVSRLGGPDWGLPGPTRAVRRPGDPSEIAR